MDGRHAIPYHVMHRARPRPPAPETAPQVNALPLKRRRGHARSLASLAVSAVTGAHAASLAST